MQVLLHLAVILAALFIFVSAQRPFYASGNSYPSVLPQYLESNSEVDNRFNGNDNSYAAFEKDPKYNVDKDLVEIVKTYPRDKQPYWYINAEQLNRFKGRPQQNVRKLRSISSKLVFH
ncbi:uncharacterized protein LOC112693744 [Sipha flava]|uniref:Uncharacterized protein LOC112693744 n=1 Tax=Sipha flava TaxID=143950 RepID=A0A2S2R997_9HEMI|nr:uncharacterized protein LOC112693744 [Sipha flava]